MKSKLTIGMCIVSCVLIGVSTKAQDMDTHSYKGSSEQSRFTKEDQTTFEEIPEINHDESQLKPLTARESRRLGRTANRSSKNAKIAYRSERKAARARAYADAQTEKAARALGKIE